MVAKPQELLKDIGSSDANVRLRAVKELKNQIIGNKHKKLSYIKLGAVPRVIELLSSTSDANLLVQSATTVGSFGLVNDGVQAILKHKGIDTLLNTLNSENPRLVEAGVRSLKLIYQSGQVSLGSYLEQSSIQRLASLLSSTISNVAEISACVLAQCCTNDAVIQTIIDAGAVPSLTTLLISSNHSKQEAALEALTALATSTPLPIATSISSTAVAAPNQACQQLFSSAAALQQLLHFLRATSARQKLLACSCISSLVSTPATTDTTTAEQLDHLARLAVPTLLKLLSESSTRADVPPVLAALLHAKPQLQQAACDAGALKQLSGFLQDPTCTGPLLAGVLRALAVLCLDHEERRAQLADSAITTAVARALEAPEASVRSAAALCVRALARSVSAMRSPSLQQAVSAPALCKLLHDADVEVQINAAAAVCNLVLEFSPAREAIVAAGGIPALAALASSMFPVLQLNSCWALSNLAFHSEADIKQQILCELSWGTMRFLLSSEERCIQEHALALLRNLCMRDAADVQLVVAWAQGELLPVLEDMLDPSHNRSAQPELVSNALYTLCNMASGNSCHKDAVCASNVPTLLLHHLRSGTTAAKLAAVWCVINLGAAADDQEASGRVSKLREIGVQEQLQQLVQGESDCELIERAKAAADMFK